MRSMDTVLDIVKISAISASLLMVTMLIPVLVFPILCIMMSPSIILAYDRGPFASVASVFLTFLFSLFVSPYYIALPFCTMFAIAGVIIGNLARKTSSFAEIVATSVFVSVGCKLLSVAVIYALFGVNVMVPDIDTIFEFFSAVLKDRGVEGLTDSVIREVLRNSILLIPSSMVMLSALEAFLGLTVANARVYRVTGEHIFEKIPFSEWHFPRNTILLLVIPFLLELTADSNDISGLLSQASINLSMVGRMIFIIQGSALAAFWLRDKGVPNIAISVIVTSAFIIPIAGDVFSCVGVIDLGIDLRNKLKDRP